MKKLVTKSISSILMSCLVVTPAWAELSPEQINSIAKQTTILIAPGLTQDLLEDLENNRNNPVDREKKSSGIWTPGSGVIIAKEGNNYYVLTVAHNFKQEHLDQKLLYGIRTWDGKVHEVQNLTDNRICPPLRGTVRKGRLIRFGCFYLHKENGLESYKLDNQSFDLAVVIFQSERYYPIASSGDSNTLKQNGKIYISGWPDPEKERAPDGGCRGKVARRQRRLAWGLVNENRNASQTDNGYSIFYSDQSRPGMSGGPVFDENGYLVGVNGRGSGQRNQLELQYCSYDKPASNDDSSSAQSVNLFSEQITQASITLPFNLELPSQADIEVGLTSLPSDVGKSDTGFFDDSDDVIEDIYEDFRVHFVESAIRARPSGTCWSLLIGEDFCNASR